MSRFFTANLTIKRIKKQPIVLFILLIIKYNHKKIGYTYIYSQKIIKITNKLTCCLKIRSFKKVSLKFYKIIKKNIELVFRIIINNECYLLPNIHNKGLKKQVYKTTGCLTIVNRSVAAVRNEI